MKKILFLIAAVAFLAAPLSSCKKSSTVYHTVKFYAGDGKFADGVNPHEVEVEDGAQVAAPEQRPTITDGVFENWYTGPDFATVYNFETPVTSDINLYAKYTSTVKVKVTFNAGEGAFADGKKEVVVENITPGSTIKAPETAPTLAGGAFTAWFSDKEFTKIWDFGTAVVTSDTTLYAAYTMKEYLPSLIKAVMTITDGSQSIDGCADFKFEYDEKNAIKSIDLKKYNIVDGKSEDIFEDSLVFVSRSGNTANFNTILITSNGRSQGSLEVHFDETYNTCAKEVSFTSSTSNEPEIIASATYKDGFLFQITLFPEQGNDLAYFIYGVSVKDKKNYSSFDFWKYENPMCIVDYTYSSNSVENHSGHTFSPAAFMSPIYSAIPMIYAANNSQEEAIYAFLSLTLLGYFGNSSALIPDSFTVTSQDPEEEHPTPFPPVSSSVTLDDNKCPSEISTKVPMPEEVESGLYPVVVSYEYKEVK